MVNLNFISSNVSNIITFGSTFNDGYITLNNNNSAFNIGAKNNCFYVKNTIDNNYAITYSNNSLNVSNINLINLNNNEIIEYPNSYTDISNYTFNSSGNLGVNTVQNIFLNVGLSWFSEPILYDTNGNFKSEYNISQYNFNPSLNIYGAWIQFTLPKTILVSHIIIGRNNIGNDVSIFNLYGFNQYSNQWDAISINTSINNINYITGQTISYNSFAIIITKVIGRNIPNLPELAYYGVIIPYVKIYGKPIININNSIKISSANIYDVNSIKLNQIILNNKSITDFNDIIFPLINIVNYTNKLVNLTGVWSNINNIAYSASNIIKYAINNTNPIATLDINGSLQFNNKLLKNAIVVSNTNFINGGNLNIKIGTLIYNNTDYFKLKLCSYDFTLNNNANYCMQEISIYGIANKNSTTYYDNIANNNIKKQRIVGINTIYTSDNSVEFYALLNNNIIDFSKPYSQYEVFTNYIYVDFENTFNTSNNFIIPNRVEFPTSGNPIISCVKNSERITTSTCNIQKYYNNLYADNLILNSSTFNNVLYNDINGTIMPSGVTRDKLLGIQNISAFPNNVPFVNSIGVLENTTTTSNQITALNIISKEYYSVPFINSTGILQATNVSNIQLTGLKTINSRPNNFVITDSNGILSTLNLPLTTNSYISALTLFSSNTPSFAYTYSNLIVGSNVNPDPLGLLFVNGQINTNTIKINNGLLTWNSNLNLLQINNNNVSDDILKNVISYPKNDTYLQSSYVTPNYIVGYQFNSTNPSYYYDNSYLFTIGYNDTLNNQYLFPTIFNNTSLSYWKSSTNFTFTAVNNFYYKTGINVENNPRYPLSGCYFTIALAKPIILISYLLSSKYINLNNTVNSFNLYGYNSSLDLYELIDARSNITNWNLNGNQNIFNVNRTKYYNKFAFCITRTNATIENDYAALYTFKLFGINFSDISSNVISINNNPITLNGNIGINSYNPLAVLSIGQDLLNSPAEGYLNINHGSNINNNGVRILNLTRPSNDTNTGIRASHILNNWGTSANTRYDINLTHQNFNNEKMVLSMISDGRVGIGITPDISQINNSLSLYSNIYLYNTNSKYVNLGIGNITDSYSIILPDYIGSTNNVLTIQNINNKNIKCNWSNVGDIFGTLNFVKIGNQNVYTCNVNPVKLQIAGSCIIGNDNNGLANITPNYIDTNSLIVVGNIYTTVDITTDSDISYKYNFKKIMNPIDKIKKLNGYTFNRNDTVDGKRYTGLIAQEVIKIIPEAVIKKHDGKLRVLYTTLAGLYVEGFKELNSIIEFQNFKINLLVIYNIILLGLLFYLI
jgi:hypothetical protein